jgi:hypothetical protein
MKTNKLWLTAIAGLLMVACSEKTPETYPWISDASVMVEPNGKMLGYEFYAKW